jgi:hypothetical protein
MIPGAGSIHEFGLECEEESSGKTPIENKRDFLEVTGEIVEMKNGR